MRWRGGRRGCRLLSPCVGPKGSGKRCCRTADDHTADLGPSRCRGGAVGSSPASYAGGRGFESLPRHAALVYARDPALALRRRDEVLSEPCKGLGRFRQWPVLKGRWSLVRWVRPDASRPPSLLRFWKPPSGSRPRPARKIVVPPPGGAGGVSSQPDDSGRTLHEECRGKGRESPAASGSVWVGHASSPVRVSTFPLG